MKIITFFTLLTLMFNGCKKDFNVNEISLTLGAYTVPKEVYQKEIIPSFKKYWKKRTGQTVTFYESYIASGAQSRTIAAGFDADIAALSLEQDIKRLENEGLITHDWKNRNGNGIVTRSLIVFVLRPGNPKNIKNWEDLSKKKVEIIYPSPKTSGGAMWVINAIYGAGQRLSEIYQGKKNSAYARNLLKNIQKKVKVMDKSGRASVTTYESGIGDVLLTYENEALLRQKQGKNFPFIIPEATILIENPVALIDKNVEKHNNREVAEAFLNFLFEEDSQRSFARYGFRPVHKNIIKEFQKKYPIPRYLFTISYLGGWENVSTKLYGHEGIWTKLFEELAGEK